jgi:hypothetical protein
MTKVLKLTAPLLYFIFCSCDKTSSLQDKQERYFVIPNILDKDTNQSNQIFVSKIQHEETSPKISENSQQYIYDFMKMVITDQRLDLSYGLSMEPLESSCVGKSDQDYLETLLINYIEPKLDDTLIYSKTTLNNSPKCLTEEDVYEMLHQKEHLQNFKWDNSRLGFNHSNKKNWYSFSKPLFSKDKTKAVIRISRLCPGLCGEGWCLMYLKENDIWTSYPGIRYFH